MQYFEGGRFDRYFENDSDVRKRKEYYLEKYDIHFDQVSFGYDGRTVLKDVRFIIPEQTTIAIVGSSGTTPLSERMLRSKIS